jgi:hypothetical protein
MAMAAKFNGFYFGARTACTDMIFDAKYLFFWNYVNDWCIPELQQV